MASLTIRKLDDRVKRELRLRAARNGISMEEEARRILTGSVVGLPLSPPGTTVPGNIVDTIWSIVDPIGGIDLDVPSREGEWEPIRFDDEDEPEPS